jgi:hypothetical protein
MLHPQNAAASATVGAPAAAASAAAKCSSPSPSRSPGDAASQRLRCPPSSDPPAPLSLPLLDSSAQLAGQQLLHLDNRPAPILDQRLSFPGGRAAAGSILGQQHRRLGPQCAIRPRPRDLGGRSEAPWPRRAEQSRGRGGVGTEQRRCSPSSTSRRDRGGTLLHLAPPQAGGDLDSELAPLVSTAGARSTAGSTAGGAKRRSDGLDSVGGGARWGASGLLGAAAAEHRQAQIRPLRSRPGLPSQQWTTASGGDIQGLLLLPRPAPLPRTPPPPPGRTREPTTARRCARGSAPLLQAVLLCAMWSSAYGWFLRMRHGKLLEMV